MIHNLHWLLVVDTVIHYIHAYCYDVIVRTADLKAATIEKYICEAFHLSLLSCLHFHCKYVSSHNGHMNSTCVNQDMMACILFPKPKFFFVSRDVFTIKDTFTYDHQTLDYEYHLQSTLLWESEPFKTKSPLKEYQSLL